MFMAVKRPKSRTEGGQSTRSSEEVLIKSGWSQGVQESGCSMNYNSGQTFGESGEGRREPKHVEETQTITKWGERWDRQNACGCSEEDRHHAVKPLTGKPYAVEPPVRFGGRGAVNPASLPLS